MYCRLIWPTSVSRLHIDSKEVAERIQLCCERHDWNWYWKSFLNQNSRPIFYNLHCKNSLCLLRCMPLHVCLKFFTISFKLDSTTLAIFPVCCGCESCNSNTWKPQCCLTVPLPCFVLCEWIIKNKVFCD